MKSITNFEAFTQGKCPRCRKGNLWTYPIWQVSKFGKMNKQCPHCQIHFEVEPGFFYGAMYVSYGFTAVIALVVGYVFLQQFPNAGDLLFALTIAVVILLLFPFIFRSSRTIYLYLFSGIDYVKE